MSLLFWIIAATTFWFLPIWVAHQIGQPKGRAGWEWGFALGWLGVIIVALLPARPARSREPGAAGEVR